ncbi:ATP-binding protein [Candidatus Palauibacter sp.]|uniref:ATP-binding protein n=1 Tax=Candidatus Palauibacter sp. TaxID=3101350 RepID=UPI003B52A515
MRQIKWPRDLAANVLQYSAKRVIRPSSRYEHASTVLTSNKGFEEWGRILGDEVMAAALLDRLLHRCHIVNIRGNSYRMRRHADLSKAIHPGAARDVSTPRATAS